MSEISKNIKEYFQNHSENVISKTDYYGNEKYEFMNGRVQYIFVIPNNPIANKWIYRTEFFGAFDYVDAKMVNDGYFLATAVISDLYGSDEAVTMMNEFYEFMVNEFMMSPDVILFGFSRGGLYATNFAIKYPERIKNIYLDAPVIDISSWPGGEGKGVGSPNEYIDCKHILNINNDADMKAYKEKLDKKLDFLATSGIPIIIVYGDSDDVVVFEENAKLLIDKCDNSISTLKVIRKPGVGHHPHSLENPIEIVEFLEKL